MARGVVLLVPALAGLPVAEYPANLIKKSVVGAGHAGKEQVQMMVRRLLPGCLIETADAADALAVAICHAHHAETAQALAAGGGARMIAKLTGLRRFRRRAIRRVVDVNGVGYLVFCSAAHAGQAAGQGRAGLAADRDPCARGSHPSLRLRRCCRSATGFAC